MWEFTSGNTDKARSVAVCLCVYTCIEAASKRARHCGEKERKGGKIICESLWEQESKQTERVQLKDRAALYSQVLWAELLIGRTNSLIDVCLFYQRECEKIFIPEHDEQSDSSQYCKTVPQWTFRPCDVRLSLSSLLTLCSSHSPPTCINLSLSPCVCARTIHSLMCKAWLGGKQMDMIFLQLSHFKHDKQIIKIWHYRPLCGSVGTEAPVRTGLILGTKIFATPLRN